MDETDGLSLWPILGLALVAGVAAWDIAKRKGLNKRSWAATCFFFPPALIGLAFTKAQQRPDETEAFRKRWASLAAYDPDIKAAVEQMTPLGPAAVEQFRMAYADVQTKEAIPLIVADIKRGRASGDGHTAGPGPLMRTPELHQRGDISEIVDARKHSLEKPRRAKTWWSGWWWKAPALLLLIVLFWPRSPRAEVPTCWACLTCQSQPCAIDGGKSVEAGHRG